MDMMRKLQAVYENGVLRPVEPLHLGEHQLVSVIVLDDVASEEDLKFEAPERFEPLADHSVSVQAVRAALSKIPGSLDADFLAERNER
jgi:predicted DNA-binding antitoxin AbrB/MazE fold protein